LLALWLKVNQFSCHSYIYARQMATNPFTPT
jgi:hypothetical protein